MKFQGSFFPPGTFVFILIASFKIINGGKTIKLQILSRLIVLTFYLTSDLKDPDLF